METSRTEQMVKLVDSQDGNDRITWRNLRLFQLPENKEDFQLIWLDSDMVDSPYSLQIQEMLQELNPVAQFYTDMSLCIDLIKTVKDEQVLLIVSGVLAQEILEQVHGIRALCGVFILCTEHERYLFLRKKYDKIVGIFVEKDSLMSSIRATMRLIEKQALAYNLFDQKQIFARNLTKDSASFFWHQLLIDVLRQMSQNERAKDDLLDKCSDYYRRSKCELTKINDFRHHYLKDDAIKWYTADTFLYRLLNKAFRTEDFELIYRFRFFIIDLCENLEHEHEKLKEESAMTLYRGQQMPSNEFEKLKKNIGGLISTNGFFSTSRDLNIALVFAGATNEWNTAVMFQIRADPSLESVIFADIDKLSTFEGEKEVLFSLGATFRIESVHYDKVNELNVVCMSSTNEGLEVSSARKRKEQELEGYSPMISFGRLIRETLGQVERAKKYFETLSITFPPNHPDLASVYTEIGAGHMIKGELNTALNYHERAYKLRQNLLPSNHPHLGVSLNNMAVIYDQKGEYERAIDLYKKATDIYENCYAGVHLRKAVLMRNIGITYMSKGDYDVALDYLTRALTMFKAVLPVEDFFIADCLGSIGDVYEKEENLEITLDYYQQRLKMIEHCLAADHPMLVENLVSVVRIYLQTQKYGEALQLCREQLVSQQETLGNHHPRIVRTLILIGNIYQEQEEFQQAFNLYLQALSTAESIRPLSYTSIIDCLREIGTCYYFRAMYDESLVYWHRQLELERKIYPSEHPHVAETLKFIGNIHFKMDEHAVALTYLQQALNIYEKTYSEHHQDVKKILIDISLVETVLQNPNPKKDQISHAPKPKLALKFWH